MTQHPSLLTLSLIKHQDALPITTPPSAKDIPQLESIRSILQVNTMLERVQLDIFYQGTSRWQTVMAPLLRRNLYAKRFAVLAATKDEHYRRALMARAMLAVSKEPQLLFLALKGSLCPLLLEE